MTNVIGTFGGQKAKHYRLAAAFVACFSVWTSTASSEPAQSANNRQYAALQSFSEDFGSRFTKGYFVSETGQCLVTLTVAKKGEQDIPASQTAERVHLFLNPGQMAGLDSEGQSVTFTCGRNATALTVDRGVRDAPMASQKSDTSNEDTSSDVIYSYLRQW